MTTLRLGGAAILLGGWLAAAGPAIAEDRPAETILAEINAVQIPRPDPKDRGNPEAMRDFTSRQRKAVEAKSALIEELHKAYPRHPELATLLPLKWRASMPDPARAEATRAEVEAILARRDDERLFAEAAFFQVWLAIGKAGTEPKFADLMPVYEAFIKRVPKDPRGAQFLAMAADLQDDPAGKAALLKRVETDYPDSPTARMIAGGRRLSGGVGKPFELEFVDAIGGSPVSMKGLRGKVVVVDFWATWCGPCVEEMPALKTLYDRYKGKGVEFIGVSLDGPKEQGGLDKLKAYVAENGIAWPQYHQGNGWESDFSTSWGIDAIPRAFLIDADGNLATTEARGELERLIPEYLAKAAGGKPAR